MTATQSLQEAVKAEVLAIDARLTALFEVLLVNEVGGKMAGAIAESLETSATIFRQLESRVPPSPMA